MYGKSTSDLLDAVYGRGVEHAVALMRHSAREYAPGKHDLENPLTEEGRVFARQLGGRLPQRLTLRGYASPPERCMETAALILSGYAEKGGAVTRHRPVEGLGVFYALDQMKMWKAMNDAGGQVPFLQAWFRGEVPSDAMIPAEVAANLVLRVVADKLKTPVASKQLDLCVSHDMTLYLVRDQILGQPADLADVQYLDALVAYAQDDALWLVSHHGEPVEITGYLRGNEGGRP